MKHQSGVGGELTAEVRMFTVTTNCESSQKQTSSELCLTIGASIAI
jgi:hypothetical protein